MSRFIMSLLVAVCFTFPAFAIADDGGYTYEGLLAIGHGQYVSQNFEGAIAQYEKAKNAESGRPEAYYFIGCAMARQKRWDEAVTVLKSAATVAGESHPAMHARALFVVAVTLEQAGDLSKARFAWAAYKEYSVAHPSITGFAAVADQRVKANEALDRRKQEYQIVRDRIAAGAGTD